jgi:hypothetical protein
MTRITGTLQEGLCTFMILLRMRNISDKNCREKQNTHFMSGKNYFENGTVYEIKCKNMVEPDRPQMTI